MDKYYVVLRSTEIWYKSYKTAYGWTKEKDKAWKFTREGALRIVSRLNDGNLNGNRFKFDLIKAEANK